MNHDDFYIGYLPTAPAGVARFVRRWAAGLLGGIGMVALGLAAGQSRSDPSVFEFGLRREFTGRILTRPYPMLEVARPGITDRRTAYSRYLLVGPGKHGAEDQVQGLDGQAVRLSASLIYRDNQTLLEVAKGSLVPAPGPSMPVDAPEPLGRFTLEGEIVDSKCYLGVMKPGWGAVHRGCATRCLSGGAPPILLLRDSLGPAAYVLLTGSDGRPMTPALLKLVATNVAVSGDVIREGDLMTLRVESIERLGP